MVKYEQQEGKVQNSKMNLCTKLPSFPFCTDCILINGSHVIHGSHTSSDLRILLLINWLNFVLNWRGDVSPVSCAESKLHFANSDFMKLNSIEREHHSAKVGDVNGVLLLIWNGEKIILIELIYRYNTNP